MLGGLTGVWGEGERFCSGMGIVFALQYSQVDEIKIIIMGFRIIPGSVSNLRSVVS
jgi:hypothetical protein